MAKYVREIVNPDLFFLGPRATMALARECMLILGISGIPILDDEGRPAGIISLRDLVRSDEEGRVESFMTTPVKTVAESAKVEDAAHMLADTGLHRLVVVDDDGRAVGMVSTLDAIRALCGMAIHFPERFQHRDKATGLEWHGDYDLTAENLDMAPEQPGLIVLRYGLPGVPEVPIWVGLSDDIRGTLTKMIEDPTDVDPLFASWGQRVHKHCRFRTAVVEDDAKRAEALSAIRATTRVRAWARQLQVA
jgi:hypothetical protein